MGYRAYGRRFDFSHTIPEILAGYSGKTAEELAPEVTVRHVNEFRPDVIGASGSYLEALFTYLHATRAAFHRPKVVVFAGEGISDAARAISAYVCCSDP